DGVWVNYYRVNLSRWNHAVLPRQSPAFAVNWGCWTAWLTSVLRRFPGGPTHLLRRSFSILVAGLALLLCGVGPAAAARSASIILHAAPGAFLYEDDAEGQRSPASLTKIMTLYLLFEAVDAKRVTFDTKFPVSVRASNQDPTKLGLKPGETIAVRDI